jgi:Family of unknown function (DUF5681)
MKANPNPQGPEAPATAPGKAGCWRKGESGNPKGRAVGCRNRASLIAAALIDGQAEELVAKAISLALEGDPIALRLCLERILPPARERPCTFKLPKLETCQDATNALAMIAEGMASGELLPHEAESLGNVIASFVQTTQLVDLVSRLNSLEAWRSEARTATGSQYDA